MPSRNPFFIALAVASSVAALVTAVWLVVAGSARPDAYGLPSAAADLAVAETWAGWTGLCLLVTGAVGAILWRDALPHADAGTPNEDLDEEEAL
jgi:hypothetical protein